jgi:REP element-mobilizing transposase RayT
MIQRSRVTPQFRYRPSPRLRRPAPGNERASASRLRDRMARPKHRATQAGTYFISTTTSQRRSLFHLPDWAAVVEDKIVQDRDQGAYRLHRYVVVPDHIHVLLTPGEVISLERAVQYIKGGSSREIGMRFQSHFPVWQPGFTEQPDTETEALRSRVPIRSFLFNACCKTSTCLDKSRITSAHKDAKPRSFAPVRTMRAGDFSRRPCAPPATDSNLQAQAMGCCVRLGSFSRREQAKP